MSELSKRIIVAAIAIPIAFAIIYLGGIIFSAAIAIISILALNEFYDIAAKKNYPTFKKFGFFVGLFPFFCFEISKLNFFDAKYLLYFSPVFILVFLISGSLLLALFSKRENAIAGIGSMFIGFFYVSFSFFALILLRNGKFIGDNFQNVENFGLFFVVITFCSIWICDSATYFVGRKFGKHKLLERVSPKKSIEGAIAGFFSAAIFFSFSAHFLLPKFNIIFAIICGISIGIFGQIGDLIESKLKRDANVKDSSNIIPGHGGILDRFDSIIFVSPILAILLMIFSIFSANNF